MKTLYCLLITGLLLTISSAGAVLSLSVPNSPQSPQPVPGNCEDNVATLSATHQTAGADGLIIVIARLGTGERSRELNHRRLHNVREYLTGFSWGRAPKTVITAEGESVEGFGRVDLYVGGKLLAVLAVKRDQDLLVGSCEPDDIRPKRTDKNLYPYLDRKPRRK